MRSRNVFPAIKSAALFVLALVSALANSGCDRILDYEMNRIPSPNGRFDAVLFGRPVVPERYLVAVTRHDGASSRGTVVYSTRMDQVHSIDLRWRTDDILTISRIAGEPSLRTSTVTINGTAVGVELVEIGSLPADLPAATLKILEARVDSADDGVEIVDKAVIASGRQGRNRFRVGYGRARIGSIPFDFVTLDKDDHVVLKDVSLKSPHITRILLRRTNSPGRLHVWETEISSRQLRCLFCDSPPENTKYASDLLTLVDFLFETDIWDGPIPLTLTVDYETPSGSSRLVVELLMTRLK